MMKKIQIIKLVIIGILLMMMACTNENDVNNGEIQKEYVTRVDTLGLKVIYPEFSKVELVCGTMPSKNDTNVVLVMAAAYTGECLNEFKHSNIVGMHVSGGKYYKGGIFNGAFVYYDGKWKFMSDSAEINAKMPLAAEHSGAGFTQDLLIYKGELHPTKRKDGNSNIFRALCEHNGKLCVIESRQKIKFSNFKKALLDFGVTNAIYTDMGSGWNYAWYRTCSGVVELQPYKHRYCTNWITFYK